eukprot:TRINITY_DN11440_c0_g1_i1.p1 TRINITY_DN11440_c0_g1~~TRINITY_DN11440_c0_g1_i1.p1  ORF type:complete len:1258 (+),score=183.33 TRINITY_DN11440_c0_g1_i1:138-3911(+)
MQPLGARFSTAVEHNGSPLLSSQRMPLQGSSRCSSSSNGLGGESLWRSSMNVSLASPPVCSRQTMSPSASQSASRLTRQTSHPASSQFHPPSPPSSLRSSPAPSLRHEQARVLAVHPVVNAPVATEVRRSFCSERIGHCPSEACSRPSARMAMATQVGVDGVSSVPVASARTGLPCALEDSGVLSPARLSFCTSAPGSLYAPPHRVVSQASSASMAAGTSWHSSSIDSGRVRAFSPQLTQRSQASCYSAGFSCSREKILRAKGLDPYMSARLALSSPKQATTRLRKGNDMMSPLVDMGPVPLRQALPLSRITRGELDSTFRGTPRQAHDQRHVAVRRISASVHSPPSGASLVTAERLQPARPQPLDVLESETDGYRRNSAEAAYCRSGNALAQILPRRRVSTVCGHEMKDCSGRLSGEPASSGDTPACGVGGNTSVTSSTHDTEPSVEKRERCVSFQAGTAHGNDSETVMRWREPSLQRAKSPSKLPSPEGENQSGRNRLSLKLVAHVVRSVVRMQVLADSANGPDCSACLQIIATVLATPEAYLRACQDLWDRIGWEYKLTSGEVERRMPLSQIPRVLAHLRIPSRHVPLVWAMLRQQDVDWESAVLPKSMDFLTFKAVLAKALRRVRNKCVGLSVAKTQFVRQNIRSFENEYLERARIGEGSFGQCFWVEHRVDKRRFACKRILKDMSQVPCEEIEVELNLMKQLDHPYVLRVFEWFETADAYLFILEGALGGDVKHMLERAIDDGSQGLEEKVVCQIVRQAILALGYIHFHCVIHRDVKPANMLLAQPVTLPATPEVLRSLRLLLADFGVSELFKPTGDDGNDGQNQKTSNVVKGTVPYISPEVFAGEVCASADVWATGVCVCELLGGRRPFNGDNHMAVFSSVRKKEPDLSKCVEAGVSEMALDFMKSVLVKDHKVRPTAQECVSHEWFVSGQDEPAPKGLATLKARRAFKKFTALSSFSKTVANCMAARVDSQKVEELSQTFLAMDRNGDGVLDIAELKEGLHKTGLDVDHVEDFIDHMDVNRDGKINYTEFVASFISGDQQMEEEMIQSAFRFFDSNGDGIISMDELQASLSNGGPLATMLPDGKTVEQVLKEIDVSKDGMISLQEFSSYLRKERGKHSSEATDAAMKTVSTWNTDHFESPCVSPHHYKLSRNTPKPFEFSSQTGAGDEESLTVVLRRMGANLNQEKKEATNDSPTHLDYKALGVEHARRLAEQHWLTTVRDLRDLGDSDWAHLGLPLKLQRMLQQLISRS